MLTDEVNQADAEWEQAKAWEQELEDQLALARAATRAALVRLETLQGLKEDFIVSGAPLPARTGYAISYRFRASNQHGERSEKIETQSRSAAIVEFWKRTPFSRLARTVEILSVSEY